MQEDCTLQMSGTWAHEDELPPAVQRLIKMPDGQGQMQTVIRGRMKPVKVLNGHHSADELICMLDCPITAASSLVQTCIKNKNFWWLAPHAPQHMHIIVTCQSAGYYLQGL